ncbi:META domain-containing protein [Sinorhizobium sp. RAC02]|uniref:META domain-containing protein n=1 Tax=Sinorhizobium sp. RAC02 TaxID=1842534 RepID=UPI00149615D9|nr:META domain-containing protein [Sinorhizobium sp. RAC02]
MAQAATFSARGNEPGWLLEITENAITFRDQDGETFSIEPVPASVAADNGATYSAVVGGEAFALTVADKGCSDTMTGMPYPKTVTLVVGERRLAGCGGDPASLLHGDWKIDAIGGKAIVKKSDPTLTFAPDGRIHGNGSCNRFFGGFTLSGEGLKLSETGASMMLCDQPLMAQERALLAAFDGVTRFEVLSPTQLQLVGLSGVLVSLRK